MPQDTTTTSVTETVTTSETDKKEGKSQEAEKTSEETTTETKKEDVVEDEPFDIESMRKTFSKLREDIRNLKKEKDDVSSKLKEKEEKEAAEKGEYKTIAERKAEELREAERKIQDLQSKIDSELANEQKKSQEQEKAINRMINQQIESWPDEAKNLIDKEGQLSAAERLKQVEKAAPLVRKLTKSSSAAPGLIPSPRDVREQGDDESAEAKERIRTAFRKGRIVSM